MVGVPNRVLGLADIDVPPEGGSVRVPARGHGCAGTGTSTSTSTPASTSTSTSTSTSKSKPEPESEPESESESVSGAGAESESRERDTAMRREGNARLIAALVALALAASMIFGTDDFALDDAWIHLSYAKSLRLGDGLSYNPGDWETGFSSPAWVLLLGAWPTGTAPVLPVKLLGALLHAATAWLATHLVLELVRTRATPERPLPALSMALLAGVFAAASPVLLHGATSGMEVPLTAAALLGCATATIAGATLAAGLTGALAVWCRPEALGFVVALAVILLVTRRWSDSDDAPSRAAVLAGPIGGVVALGLWIAWCLAVSGHPWPNTQYVKGTGGGLSGLSYLVGDVLPWEPWLVSLTGVVLVALAVHADVRARRFELVAVLVAVAATWVAIAISRPLHPGTGFYESRYFAPMSALVPVVLPFGLIGRKPWQAWALVMPVVVLIGVQITDVQERLADQCDDTETVHTAVARTVASDLPRDAVIAVEGAGAIRWFAPRTMTVVDIVGLNDGRAAHLHFDKRAKMCHFVRRTPTHFAIPAEWIEQFSPVFRLRPVARFDDPRYTQVDPPRPLTVVLLAVDQIHPAWVEGCAGEDAME